MRRHSRRAGAPAAGERDADAQRRPALSNRARERRQRPKAAPTPPAPRPRDQRRSTAPKLPTTQGRRRRQLPVATSAAPLQSSPRLSLAAAVSVMAQHHVTSHAVQPRQWLRGQRIEPPPRHQKRLGSDLIRRLPASTARGIGVYRAIRVLIQVREALGASVGHGAHATLIIDPPPNLSGQPEKSYRDPSCPLPVRALSSRARDGELIDKTPTQRRLSRHVATLESHRTGHPAGRPDRSCGLTGKVCEYRRKSQLSCGRQGRSRCGALLVRGLAGRRRGPRGSLRETPLRSDGCLRVSCGRRVWRSVRASRRVRLRAVRCRVGSE